MQDTLHDEMKVVQEKWQEELHKKQPEKSLRGIGFFKRQVIYHKYKSHYLTHESCHIIYV